MTLSTVAGTIATTKFYKNPSTTPTIKFPPPPPAYAALGDLFRPTERALWQEYIRLEEDGLRPQALEALSTFIEALLLYPEPERSAWAAAICKISDDDGPLFQWLHVRQPLVRRILLPFLLEAYAAKEPSSARWLAYFSPRVREFLPESVSIMWADDLLLEALRQDPQDFLSRRRLIEQMAQRFDYGIHEVPMGVRYGANGASIAECVEMLGDLEEFSCLVVTAGMLPQYEERIEKWRFLIDGYRDYLSHRSEYKNFEDYLERKGFRP